jgi:hypothetical protein
MGKKVNSMKVNTKIYTSIEEVVLDYTNREDKNSIIFHNEVFLFPIEVSRAGDSFDVKFKEIWSPGDGYFDRSALFRASDIVEVMEKWSRMGLAYSKEIKKIAEFIKEGGYLWIAHRILGSNMSSFGGKVYYRDNYRDKEKLDEIKNIISKFEEKNIANFFERLAELALKWKEEELDKYWSRELKNKIVAVDPYYSGENEKDLANIAKDVERTFREQKSISYYEDVSIEKIIAVFGKSGGKVGEFHYAPASKFVNNAYIDYILYKNFNEEREVYNKIGILPFIPNTFFIESRKIKQPSTYDFLSISQLKPESIEVGFIFFGYKEEYPSKYDVFFVPFIATKSKISIKIFRGETKYRGGRGYYRILSNKEHYPIYIAYSNETPNGLRPGHRPKIQLLSFSYGPKLSLFCQKEEAKKFLYAPLFEHVFPHGKEGEGVKSLRTIVANKNALNEEYNDKSEIKKFINILLKLVNIPTPNKEQELKVEVDLTERNKIIEMIGFAKEYIESEIGVIKNTLETFRAIIRKLGFSKIIGGKGKDVDKESLEDSDYIFIAPQGLKKEEVIDKITKDLCYSAKGSRIYVKAIEKDFLRDGKDILRMGASISGSFAIDIEGTRLFPINVKNLYDVIIMCIEELFQPGTKKRSRKGIAGLISLIKEASMFSEDIRERYKVAVSVKGGETKSKLKIIRNSERLPGFDIYKTAKEIIPRIERELENSNGPNISIMFEYVPKISVYFSEKYCQEKEVKDLENMLNKGHIPKILEIRSYIKNASVFMDFDKEGIRVISINQLP